MTTNSVELKRRQLRGPLITVLLAAALIVAILPGAVDARSGATATPVTTVSQNTGPSILPAFRLYVFLTYIWYGPEQAVKGEIKVQTPALTSPNLPEEPEPLIVTGPGVEPTKYLTNSCN